MSASPGSNAPAKRARSAVERASSPRWAMRGTNTFDPAIDVNPSEGLSANAPQNEAGSVVDAVCWVPSANGTISSTTAAAEPADDTPGDRDRSWGLRVGLGWYIPNSDVVVLPMTIAPALRSMATAAASVTGWRPRSVSLPYSDGISCVSNTSFTPTGRPCSGPSGRPSARCRSASLACSSARSGSRNAQALICGSRAAIRSRHAIISSQALICPCLSLAIRMWAATRFKSAPDITEGMSSRHPVAEAYAAHIFRRHRIDAARPQPELAACRKAVAAGTVAIRS